MKFNLSCMSFCLSNEFPAIHLNFFAECKPGNSPDNVGYILDTICKMMKTSTRLTWQGNAEFFTLTDYHDVT